MHERLYESHMPHACIVNIELWIIGVRGKHKYMLWNTGISAHITLDAYTYRI